MATENERVPGVSQPSTSVGAVFLSYASEDAAAAERIANALRGAGIEVWFDRSELRGGDAWDRQIRKQIHDCALFIAVISARTDARIEGYFRREWKLAVERTHDRLDDAPFLVPVVIDQTTDSIARVPDKFRELQWTRLPDGETPHAFIERIRRLLEPAEHGAAPAPSAPRVALTPRKSIPSPWRSKRALGAIGTAVVLALAYFAAERQWVSKRAGTDQAAAVAPQESSSVSSTAPTKPSTATAANSIAVLPFVDLSEKHDQEYFADGMAEEVIDLLAKVPNLRVPARTSSFYFKGKQAKIPDIARELSVANVLEGSIRRSGNRLRVTAQLVRADTGFHLWSQTYDRNVHDVFSVQDDIANAVVQALQITILGGPLTRREGGTQNLEAYQLYLRGLSANRQGARGSLKVARDYFDQALKLDREFGLAWLELSMDTALLTDIGVLTPKDGYEQAGKLAQHALQVSPNLAEAHALLSYIHRTFDWDWAAADAESRRALALDPTNPTALMLASGVSSTLGRWDEAQRLARSALVRDPFFALATSWLGIAQYGAGHFADAEATFRRMLELAPEFSWARVYIAKALIAQDKTEAALSIIMQEQDEEERLIMLSIAFKAAHRQAEADEALKALAAKLADSAAYWVAMTYAHRGNNDLALQWLDRAYQQKDVALGEIVGEPLFKNVATDPRFKAFLRKMNLPE